MKYLHSKKTRVGTIIKTNHHILLVKTKGQDKWGIPKGLPFPSEDINKASLRELKEETGFHLKDFEIVDSNYVKSKQHHIFIYHIEPPLPIPHPIDIKEIEDAIWFPLENLEKKHLNYFTKVIWIDCGMLKKERIPLSI
jgi:ADP-ribose pyrophosphatase YjhB (NUDIX family)